MPTRLHRLLQLHNCQTLLEFFSQLSEPYENGMTSKFASAKMIDTNLINCPTTEEVPKFLEVPSTKVCKN